MPLSSCTTWKHSFQYILIATLEASILRVDPLRAKTGSFGDHILETPLTKWEGMNHRVERFAHWFHLTSALKCLILSKTNWHKTFERSENVSAVRSNLQLLGKVLKNIECLYFCWTHQSRTIQFLHNINRK